jgi:ketosteroid isomerase-like protein
MDRSDVDGWIARYTAAWTSNEPTDVEALFTEDAEYYTSPVKDPWRGRDEIMRLWIEHGDQPGSWRFTSETIAVDGDLGVVRANTTYQDGPAYANLWLIRLDDHGRCRSFTEWFMRQP